MKKNQSNVNINKFPDSEVNKKKVTFIHSNLILNSEQLSSAEYDPLQIQVLLPNAKRDKEPTSGMSRKDDQQYDQLNPVPELRRSNRER